MNICGHYMDIHVKYKSLWLSLFTYNTHIMSTNNHKFHVRGSNDRLGLKYLFQYQDTVFVLFGALSGTVEYLPLFLYVSEQCLILDAGKEAEIEKIGQVEVVNLFFQLGQFVQGECFSFQSQIHVRVGLVVPSGSGAIHNHFLNLWDGGDDCDELLNVFFRKSKHNSSPD